MGLHRGHKWDERLRRECPVCGRTCANEQGFLSHLRRKHPEEYQQYQATSGIAGAESKPREKEGLPPGDVAPITPASTRALKTEVELLTLEKKKRELLRELGNGQPQHYPDLSEIAGVGELDPTIKQQLQSRMFATQPPAQPKQDWTALLNSPNLPLILNGIKGLLGVSQGGDVASLLKDMGFSLKDLIVQSMAPKGDGSLKIAGMDLNGISLTPELLTGILQFKAAEEKAKSDLEGRKTMAASLDRLLAVIVPQAAEKLGRDAVGGGISHQPEVERVILTCPLCQAKTEVPPGTQPGTTIQCVTEGCNMSWTSESDSVPSRPAKPKERQAKVKEPERDIIHCSCGQAIDVTGHHPGDRVECGACGETHTVISETEAIPAMEPSRREEY